MRFFPLALVLIVASSSFAQNLDSKDKELLEELLRTTVYDPPPEAQRMVVKFPLRTCWANTVEVDREGWLLPGKGDRPLQWVWADGESTAPIGTAAPIVFDLVESAKKRFEPKREDDEPLFSHMSRTSGHGPQTDHDIAVAAWLHRRGADELAAKILEKFRASLRKDGEQSLGKHVRWDLSWQAFAKLVHAYMVRADEEALAHGKRLLERFPEEAKAWEQAVTIVAELERRKKMGTLGVAPPTKLPEHVARMTSEERVAWLVDALEEVDARQSGQPGGIDIASDWRVEALIEEGDAAVPALIDAVEKDPRLTRCVHFWRDFSPSRTVLSVREAALVAAMSILRVAVFSPGSTGDNFTASTSERAKAVAERLRAYWEKNKHLEIEERMRAVLLAESSTQEQMREAAENLADLTGKRRIGTTVWGTGTIAGSKDAPNPALRLEKPTAAEAILSALDRDLALGDPRWKDDPRATLRARQRAETHYVECLIGLGDKRIAPELRKRCENADAMRMRRQWAFALHVLGDSEPLRAFFAAFRTGRLDFPPIGDPGRSDYVEDEPGAVELRGVVATVLRSRLAEGEDALLAATQPGHPFHERLEAVATRPSSSYESRMLFGHPWFLELLVQKLDDERLTGTVFYVEEERIIEERDSSRGSAGTIEGLGPLAARAEERACDRAAMHLGRFLVGLPRCHALQLDREEHRARLKTLARRFARHARRATREEERVLGRDPAGSIFLPGVALDHAATAADVASGRAIFELRGEGVRVDMKLPARATLKVGKDATVPVLVLQAEKRGEVRRYGVVAADRILEVGEDELTAIAPLQ